MTYLYYTTYQKKRKNIPPIRKNIPPIQKNEEDYHYSKVWKDCLGARRRVFGCPNAHSSGKNKDIYIYLLDFPNQTPIHFVEVYPSYAYPSLCSFDLAGKAGGRRALWPRQYYGSKAGILSLVTERRTYRHIIINMYWKRKWSQEWQKQYQCNIS